MRVNYQGLLNQTLGAIGSTASTLKFLYNQDPTVIEHKTQAAKQKQREEEANELKAERHKTIKDIKIDELYNAVENMDPVDINAVKNRADKLNNEYAKLRNISSRIYDLEPNYGNSLDEELFNRFAAKRQDFLQQRVGDRMASSLFEKMITTKDQEESSRLRKEYLADRAKRGPDIENVGLAKDIIDTSKRLPDYADRRAEDKKLFEKGVKKK